MAGGLTIDNINGKVISSSPVATESQVIGVGQTWQDVTASRVAGTTYTNSTGKPIYLVFYGNDIAGQALGLKFYVNGVLVSPSAGMGGAVGAAYYMSHTLIVPPNSTYSATWNTSANVGGWFELR